MPGGLLCGGHGPAPGVVGERQPWPKLSMAPAGMWELLPAISCPLPVAEACGAPLS